MLWNPKSLKEIREHHRRFRPDAWLVHNVFPVGSAAIYREAASIGIPIVQYVHNFRPFSVNGYLWAANRLAVGGLSRDYWTEIRHGAWQNSRLRTAWLAFTLSIMHALGWWNSVKVWIAVSDFVRQKFIAAGIPAGNFFPALLLETGTASADIRRSTLSILGPSYRGQGDFDIARCLGNFGTRVWLGCAEVIDWRRWPTSLPHRSEGRANALRSVLPDILGETTRETPWQSVAR